MKKVKNNYTNLPLYENNLRERINTALVMLSYLVTPDNTEQIKEIVNILEGKIVNKDLIEQINADIELAKWEIESDGLEEQDQEALNELGHIRWNLHPILQPVYHQLWKHKYHQFRHCDITTHAAKTSNKNFMKFIFTGKEPAFSSGKLSKRNLPTEIFKYLISNGILSEKDLSSYSTNAFGRKFAAKLGDILFENEISEQDINYKRFNRVDFNSIKNSKYKGILYISNQWDIDSIGKFCKHILEKYSDDIFIYAVIAERDVPKSLSNQYNCTEELTSYELKNLPEKKEWVKDREPSIKNNLRADERIIEYSEDLVKSNPRPISMEDIRGIVGNKFNSNE